MDESFLNLVAAAAQMSPFTHVELAIGNEHGSSGQMSNVCRVFNDDTGSAAYRVAGRECHARSRVDSLCLRALRVELASRTGRNPQVRAAARPNDTRRSQAARGVFVRSTRTSRSGAQSGTNCGCLHTHANSWGSHSLPSAWREALSTQGQRTARATSAPVCVRRLAQSTAFPRCGTSLTWRCAALRCAELVADVLKKGGLMCASPTRAVARGRCAARPCRAHGHAAAQASQQQPRSRNSRDATPDVQGQGRMRGKSVRASAFCRLCERAGGGGAASLQSHHARQYTAAQVARDEQPLGATRKRRQAQRGSTSRSAAMCTRLGQGQEV